MTVTEIKKTVVQDALERLIADGGGMSEWATATGDETSGFKRYDCILLVIPGTHAHLTTDVVRYLRMLANDYMFTESIGTEEAKP